MSMQGGEQEKKTLEQLLDEIEAESHVPAKDTEAVHHGPSEAVSPTAILQLANQLPALMSVLRGAPTSEGKETPDPQALLCALRPYLSSRRREAIDSMLQLWKIRTLLQKLRQE